MHSVHLAREVLSHIHYLLAFIVPGELLLCSVQERGVFFTVDVMHLYLSTLTDVNSIVCGVHGVKPELQTFFGGYTLYGNNH